MAYERLTKTKWTNDNCKPAYDKNGNIVMDKELFDLLITEHNRLAEYEDDEESGKIVRLPCKVGDSIWVVDESWGYREDGTWGSTSEIHEGKAYSFTYYGNCIHVEDDCTSNYYLWGEDAFLTREEAEKKLQELQNG